MVIHRLKKEGIVYVLIFCISQITVAGVNPFGIALAISTVSSGYAVWLVIIASLLGNAIVYANDIFINLITLMIFSFFLYLIERKRIKYNYMIKTIIFTCIYAITNIIVKYPQMNFLNTLILILEIIIVTSSCLVFNVGINYLVKKDITREMNLQEKISLALIITFMGIYIIQVRDDNITLLKVVIIYLLSFVGTIMYKAIISITREKHFSYGQVYNNMVHNKLSMYAEAVKKMSKSIGLITKDNNQMKYEQGTLIFEKISEKYCSNCDRCSYCWEKEFESTYESANIMMMTGIENGVLTMKDIPKVFLVRCKKRNEIIESTNINLELARNNIWWQNKVDEMKQIMSMQLKDLALSINNFSSNIYKNIYLDSSNEKKIRYVLKHLGIHIKDMYCYENKGVKEIIMTVKTKGGKVKTNDIAAEISNILCERYKVGEYTPRVINSKIVEINFIKEEEYRIAASCMSIKKDQEQYSGDNYSIIEDDATDTILILSDGMGSGEDAYKESKRTIEMMEELLTVGFSKDIALNLVNSAMYLDCDENSKYSTLDICMFNRYTGMCDFVKVGAVSTFIKRGNDIIEVTSDSLPIGVFNNTEYKSNSIRLYDGDIVIMMTDGLCDSMPSYVDWKEELIYVIKSIDSYNPERIIKYILEELLPDCELIDDVTLLVGVIWNNSNV